MDQPVGIAVIGCGYWGINYVRVMDELPEARVVTVCEPRSDRLNEIRRRFPWISLTTNVVEALQSDGVEAVVICTEASSHHPIAQHCLKSGKHVLVEKPITIRAEDAADLIAWAEDAGVKLMVGHTFLYNDGVRRVKTYIDRAEIGEIYYLYARRTNLGPIRRDVNALWDLAPHDISIFNFLLDRTPDWVSAVGSKVLRNHREDVGFITLGYGSHIIAHIHVSWADPHKVREVVVVGSNRRVLFDDLNPLEKVRIFEKGVFQVKDEASSYGEYQLLMRDGDILSPHIEVSEPLKNQCLHFLECVREDIQPLTSGRAGMDVVRVMEAVNLSLAQKGAPVRVKPYEDITQDLWKRSNGQAVRAKAYEYHD